MGIEPTSEAWEAPVLPLNYARSLFNILLRIELAHVGSWDGLDPRRMALLLKARFLSKWDVDGTSFEPYNGLENRRHLSMSCHSKLRERRAQETTVAFRCIRS